MATSSLIYSLSSSSTPTTSSSSSSSKRQKPIVAQQEGDWHLNCLNWTGKMAKCSRYGSATIAEVEASQKGISRWLMDSFKFIRGKDALGFHLSREANDGIRQNLEALKGVIAFAKPTNLTQKLTLQMQKLIPPSPDRFEKVVENFPSVPDAIKAYIATYLPEKSGLCFIREQIKVNHPSGFNMLINFIKAGHVPLRALELTTEEIQRLSLDMGVWQNISKYVLDRSDIDVYLSIIRTALSSNAEDKQIIAAYRSMVDLISLGYSESFANGRLCRDQILTSDEITGIVEHIDKISITFDDQPLRPSYKEILAILSQLLRSRPDMAMTHWIKYVNAGMPITKFANELMITLTPSIKARITRLILDPEVNIGSYKKQYDFEKLADFIGSFPGLKHLDFGGNSYFDRDIDLMYLPPNCQQLISLRYWGGEVARSTCNVLSALSELQR